jgi:DNA polymerase III delta prime subunit
MKESLIPSSPEQMQRFFKAAQIFTPSAPIDSQDLFAGRQEQINRVISAIAQKGQHVILYGERGVGKTSFATVISQLIKKFSDKEVYSSIINCDAIDNFVSLWQKVFREFDNLRDEANKSPEEITPESIRYSLQRKLGKTIIVIDELDRINDSSTTTLLSDTIKTLSDHLVDVTLILVGVADSVNDLIQQHISIERSLVQVLMPRMTVVELHELIDKRLVMIDEKIEDQVKERIVFLSQGLPTFTHLLSLYASQNAISRNSNCIQSCDLNFAIQMAVEKAFQSIIDVYHKATFSARETIYSQVLLACALAKKDNLGFFASSDVIAPISSIMRKSYTISGFARHLNDLCEEKRGTVLMKQGSSRSYRYRFFNPMLQPYIIMHSLANNLITQVDLDKL